MRRESAPGEASRGAVALARSAPESAWVSVSIRTNATFCPPLVPAGSRSGRSLTSALSFVYAVRLAAGGPADSIGLPFQGEGRDREVQLKAQRRAAEAVMGRAIPSMIYSTMAAALQRANAELQNLTLHDTLTKLPNRALLEDRVEQAIASCKRAGSACAVLFADLGRFKTVNDSLGRPAGDHLLRTAAERLRSIVRMG